VKEVSGWGITNCTGKDKKSKGPDHPEKERKLRRRNLQKQE